jgi:peptide chain release factor 1
MFDKLAQIETRYEELNRLIEENAQDYQRVAELAKERAEIEPIVTAYRQHIQLTKQLSDARELLASGDKDMIDLAEAEISELEPRLSDLEKQLKMMLLPTDPRDSRNVIVEIRAGTGGDEAGLFAADLMRMIMLYAERKNWSVEILSQNETGVGGFKEVTFLVKGRGAYSKLKYESGVHRVQRVPATEAQGRIHTSTATVVVLAEVDEVDVQIPESDIRVDIYRSAGAGGQNVQKNATAVRMTHIPTGLVVACQDERSQLQNRLRALSILRARLYDMELEKRQSELDQTRRSQVAGAERSEKIRTYNYPQSRVTDHRINVSSYNLPAVMNGDLDIFIEELSQQTETARLSASQGEDDSD